MDSNVEACENPESKSPEEQLQILASQPPFATASLSLPTTLATHFFIQPKTHSCFSFQSPNEVKVPTQASSLSHLSLSSISSPSTSNNPLSLAPRRPLGPSNGAAIRRASIVWFRNDLRVHDNECLNTANNDSMSVLPVYCFDPRDYGKTSSGFDKTGPLKATFLIESVSDLRKNLQERGSDLVVRVGNPESVLVELAKAIGADAIYAHREVSNDEVKAEERVETAMEEEGVEVKFFWGSTLFHVDDLPFKLEDMPTNYGGFRDKVNGLEIRKTIEALDQMKGMPSRGDVETGDIPSFTDLGQDGRPSVRASMVGGETKALQRLQTIADGCRAQPHKGGKDGIQDSIYGANFSCKISPWLAMGCLSPRSMFEELKKTTNRSISATSKKNDDGSGSPDTGTSWLMFELLWRDFFRFITKKYSCAKVGAAPATACTSALA